MSLDYSKWDVLSRQVEQEETEAKEALRKERKDKYEREQAEKRDKWKQEHRGEPLPESSCCGYAGPEQLQKMQQKKGDDMPLEERNRRKYLAVMATREDGNRLFKEGQYEQAYAVYERGVLIVNGIYSMESTQYQEMLEMETVLNLNMAQVRLKQEQYQDAIKQCHIVLNQDAASVKAYYRLGTAYAALGELEEARTALESAHQLAPADASVASKLKSIQRSIRKQHSKTLASQKQFAANLARSSE